jgi:hypothetical protein
VLAVVLAVKLVGAVLHLLGVLLLIGLLAAAAWFVLFRRSA